MSSYFDYQSRKTRPREQVREELPAVADELRLAESMEVEESDPSATWLGRVFRWPKGTP